MAFKLTYSDGQETDYDDKTKWEVENGVVKMGRESGKWTVFISPSHWATLELTAGKEKDKKADDDHKDNGQEKHKDKDQDKHKEGKGQDKDKEDDEEHDEEGKDKDA
jgi:hypothetical protein